ncbi:MAG: cupredoxin domain-containing protein [Acidobacteria bacterium]|nr:cupredoxin domain-containing protein [Acidobacteriota bacterium]
MRLSRLFAVFAGIAAILLGASSRSDSRSSAQTAEPRVIDVVAQRYEFVPSTIEVLQGERVRIVVTSGDGFHGFGIKQFGVSKEIPRGDTVTIEFTPDVAGEFPILCTEYCGDGHENMKGQLIVKAREVEQS